MEQLSGLSQAGYDTREAMTRWANRGLVGGPRRDSAPMMGTNAQQNADALAAWRAFQDQSAQNYSRMTGGMAQGASIDPATGRKVQYGLEGSSERLQGLTRNVVDPFGGSERRGRAARGLRDTELREGYAARARAEQAAARGLPGGPTPETQQKLILKAFEQRFAAQQGALERALKVADTKEKRAEVRNAARDSILKSINDEAERSVQAAMKDGTTPMSAADAEKIRARVKQRELQMWVGRLSESDPEMVRLLGVQTQQAGAQGGIKAKRKPTAAEKAEYERLRAMAKTPGSFTPADTARKRELDQLDWG